MSQQTDSGKYVSYVDARSSSQSTGVAFTSASCESLSSIVRNRTFYAGRELHSIQNEARNIFNDTPKEG